MNQKVMLVEKERFLLNDNCKYMITGRVSKEADIECYLDGIRLPSETNLITVMTGFMRAVETKNPGGKWVEVLVTLPENLQNYKKLQVYAVNGKERFLWYKMKTSDLMRKQGKPQLFVDGESIVREQKKVILAGWAVGTTPVSLQVYDENKKPVKITLKRNTRMDVAEMFRECEVNKDCGFHIQAENVSGKKAYLVAKDENGKKAVYQIGISKGERFKAKASLYSKKAMENYRSNGIHTVIRKSLIKLEALSKGDGLYQTWLKENRVTKKELNQQRKTVFRENIKFSLVVPLYKTDKYLLKALVDSVLAQTYSNWELCLSDGSGADSPIRSILEEYQKKDPRIKVVFNEKQLQISDNTNAAIGIATGNYIAFADHDDTLAEEAFYQMAKEISQHPEADLIYSDEDIIDIRGNRLFPHFKPDFNPDYLCCVNYICHLVVVKRTLLDRTGLLRPEYDGSQDFDFLLRCTEHTDSEKIRHIPKILYHWRSHEGSTAGNPDDKPYAVIAGEKALAGHYERMGIKAEVEMTDRPGWYRSHVVIDGEPMISIIIPNKDHIDDLDLCITSIEEKSTWKNYEILVVENNSEQKDTFVYYEELQRRYNNVRILTWKKEFNYSAINNFAVRESRGEYLLFLNNDVEIITPSWMEEMLQICQQKGVGMVGAKLYYPDDTIQHAGVVLGLGGIAGHIMCKANRDEIGYMGRLVSVQEISAVTAACMMMKASVFCDAGGFDEELRVAFNDIDLCMQVRSMGEKIVFTPYAELYHYESKSRGLEDTPEKQLRFGKEVKCFKRKWERDLLKGDPYYSPNLSLKEGDCSLRKEERNGEYHA